MTTYRIELFDTALSDLENIKAYYMHEASLSVAVSVLNRIRARVDSLADMPKAHSFYREDKRFRRLVADKYLVFYDINEETHTVEIHHVWHGMRNIEKLLEEKR